MSFDPTTFASPKIKAAKSLCDMLKKENNIKVFNFIKNIVLSYSVKIKGLVENMIMEKYYYKLVLEDYKSKIDAADISDKYRSYCKCVLTAKYKNLMNEFGINTNSA